MKDALEQFVLKPTPARFEQARIALIQGDGFDPHSTQLAQLTRLWEKEAWEAMAGMAEELLPSWSLSPRIHFLLADAAVQLADFEEAEIRSYLYDICLQGLLATGKGTRRSPYRVCQLSDEQDILLSLGLRKKSQRLMQTGRRSCDVLTCTDGSEIWFDVSAILAVPAPAPRITARQSETTSV